MIHPDDDPEWTDAELTIARYLRRVPGYRVTLGGENPNGRLIDGLFGGDGSAGHKLDRLIVIGNGFYIEEAT